jgi:hypothetical protein
LDKTNCEAAQQNLTKDFIRIAMRHRKEVELMLEQHNQLVSELLTELEAVTKPIAPARPNQAITLEDDEDEETEVEPLILGELTEDRGSCCILVYIGYCFIFLRSSCGFDV